MEFYEYIKPELLILIPVMYLIGIVIKKSSIKDEYIPLILGVISIILCSIWVLSTTYIFKVKEVFTAVFTSITQGTLISGASVYINQIYKQSKHDTNNDKH